MSTNELQLKNAIAKAKCTRHVTTVKVFVGVTILFLVSYTPAIMRVSMVEGLFLKYVYMINHIGNPIIYYAMNKQFRENANALLGKWIRKCR